MILAYSKLGYSRFSLRYWSGVVPVSFLNIRSKCPALSKPVRSATAMIFSSVSRSSRCASRMRVRLTYSISVNPVTALKERLR